MRRAAAVIALLLAPAWATPPADAAAGGDILLGFHAFPEIVRGDLWHGARVLHANPALGFAAVKEPFLGWSETIRSDPRLRYVERDAPVQALLVPNDPLWTSQYGPARVRAPAAWDVTLGTSAKTVCVVDTGVRYTHADLASRWLGGRNVLANSDDPWDDHGHGTHVAGIAAAGLANGIGMAGMSNAGILGVKVLDAFGWGTHASIATGIQWCADNGGDIINLSLGSTVPSATLEQAVNYAVARGSLLVAAAGNHGPCTDCILYPARYAAVVAVACTTSADSLCAFSSAGPEVDLAAPGLEILSAYRSSDGSYATMSGTSMSAPHVAGAAALVWSVAPHLGAAEVAAILTETAVDQGPLGPDPQFGRGLLDAGGAVDMATLSPEFSIRCHGRLCEFDGRASRAGDVPPAGWHWLFDGKTEQSGAVVDYIFPAYGTRTARLTIESASGARSSTSRTVTLVEGPARPMPAAPPAAPHIVDPAGDTPNAAADITAAWFDFDSERLYAGLKVVDLRPPRGVAHGVQHRIDFAPQWLADPSWNGRTPETHFLRLFATTPGTHVTDSGYRAELQAIRVVDGQEHITVVGVTPRDLTLQVNENTGMLWWSVRRGAVQDPPRIADFLAMEAHTSYPGTVPVTSLRLEDRAIGSQRVVVPDPWA